MCEGYAPSIMHNSHKRYSASIHSEVFLQVPMYSALAFTTNRSKQNIPYLVDTKTYRTSLICLIQGVYHCYVLDIKTDHFHYLNKLQGYPSRDLPSLTLLQLVSKWQTDPCIVNFISRILQEATNDDEKETLTLTDLSHFQYQILLIYVYITVLNYTKKYDARQSLSKLN